jgi:hypothetical protein
MNISKQYTNDNADLYQKFDKKKGCHTHIHALHTAAFAEQFVDKLPACFIEKNSPPESDTLIKLWQLGVNSPPPYVRVVVTSGAQRSAGAGAQHFSIGGAGG